MHTIFRRNRLSSLLFVISVVALSASQLNARTTNRQAIGDPAAFLRQAQSASGKSAYDSAVLGFITSLQASVPPSSWSQPFDIESYKVIFNRATSDGAIWDPSYFDSLIPASAIRVKNLRKRIVVNGAGVAFVGVRSLTPERMRLTPFLPQQTGLSCPVTVVLRFQPGSTAGAPVEAIVTLYNPKQSTDALAADYSAPVEVLIDHAPSDDFILKAFLKPGEYQHITGLFMLEPYSPTRIPVILVHGLDSSPRTWQEVYNGLMADPNVRQRYQFWLFRYPTGNPVTLSAANFRDSISALRAAYDPASNNPYFNHMVVVGHSMGGLLTRLLVTESGDAFWNVHSSVPFEQANLSQEDRAQLSRALFFRPEPYVSRVVFISTPHRGSMLAEGDMGKLAAKLVKVPGTLLDGGVRAVNGGGIGDLSNHIPNSIDNLSPSNAFVRTLQVQPIRVPHHSIVGNQGVTVRGVPASDSVVPYWSSHLETAESEVVVASDHGAHHHPKGIEELRRILTMHLNSR